MAVLEHSNTGQAFVRAAQALAWRQPPLASGVSSSSSHAAPPFVSKSGATEVSQPASQPATTHVLATDTLRSSSRPGSLLSGRVGSVHVLLQGSLAALVILSLWAVFSGNQRNYAGRSTPPP